MRVIVLDAGPLGLASKSRGKPDVDRCRQWIQSIEDAGARVVVPDVADYEVRLSRFPGIDARHWDTILA